MTVSPTAASRQPAHVPWSYRGLLHGFHPLPCRPRSPRLGHPPFSTRACFGISGAKHDSALPTEAQSSGGGGSLEKSSFGDEDAQRQLSLFFLGWHPGTVATRGPCHRRRMSQPSDGSQRSGSEARSISGCWFWRQKVPLAEISYTSPWRAGAHPGAQPALGICRALLPRAPAKDRRDVPYPAPHMCAVGMGMTLAKWAGSPEIPSTTFLFPPPAPPAPEAGEGCGWLSSHCEVGGGARAWEPNAGLRPCPRCGTLGKHLSLSVQLPGATPVSQPERRSREESEHGHCSPPGPSGAQHTVPQYLCAQS